VKKATTETWIENKLHKVSDKDTLTPVLTAIGLEMSEGIANVDQIENVIVEGPSEYFYLTAFRLLHNASKLNFIWGGGATSMPLVGTILHGWGCNVIYLYDNDKGAKDAEKSLRRNWITVTPDMLSKIPIEGAIEDIFPREDFASIVADVAPEEIKGSNSDYIKGKDKVLHARKFLQRVRSKEKMALSPEFRKRVSALMEHLSNKMKEARP
jgi:predicted ATP-dependent endonuclease of OLD family